MTQLDRSTVSAAARPWAAVLFALALVVPVGFAVIGSSSASASDVPVQPFDQASPSELRSSPKKVFAHYMGTLPVSIDNKTADVDYYTRQYQNPAGEGGIHAAYGGFTRDRPLPVTPKASDFRLRNLETEVRQAIGAGVDGFTLNIMALPGTGDPNVANATGLMLQAARNVDAGFKIVLMPDMDTSTGRQTPQVLASHLASFGSSPAAYRLPDGRLVISPYNAHKQPVAYWTQFLNSMATTHNTPVAFWPLVQNVAAHRDAFAPISYGMSNWGTRTPAWNPPTVTYSTGPLGQIKITRDRGLKWMQPVSVQDARPNAGLFWEAENTQNLRNTWQIARDSGAEWVQLTTWNDYTEGSHIAPSAGQGYSWLDLQAYYISWFKTGVQPTIVRDGITLTHRTQLAATKPSYPQTKLMVNAGGSPTRDTIEAHSFLTAPATITIKAGTQTTTCAAPAGVSTCTAPLVVGEVSADVTRDGLVSAGVTSPRPVTATPYLQDLHYTAATTGRNPTAPAPVVQDIVTTAPTPTATAVPVVTPIPTPTVAPVVTPTPAPIVTPTPTPIPIPTGPATVVSLSATADTYANEGAMTANYGRSSSLASRGSVGAISYLRFGFPAAPNGKSLTGAKLVIKTTTLASAGTVEPHLVKVANNSWNESRLNWNNKSLSGWTIGTLVNAPAVSTSYSVSLDADVLASLSGAQTLSVSNDGSDSLWFWSTNSKNAGDRPKLVLTYQ